MNCAQKGNNATHNSVQQHNLINAVLTLARFNKGILRALLKKPLDYSLFREKYNNQSFHLLSVELGFLSIETGLNTVVFCSQ